MDLAKQNELFLVKFLAILTMVSAPFLGFFIPSYNSINSPDFVIVFFSGFLLLIIYFAMKQKYENPEKYKKNVDGLKEVPKFIGFILLGTAIAGIIWWIFSTVSPLIILLVVIVFLLGYIAVRLS